MPTIESRTRHNIATFLPDAIKGALNSYLEFSQDETSDDKSSKAKQFKDHHDACKVAIAHIELLIKLARWADLPDPKADNAIHQAILESVIENGQSELDQKEKSMTGKSNHND